MSESFGLLESNYCEFKKIEMVQAMTGHVNMTKIGDEFYSSSAIDYYLNDVHGKTRRSPFD